MLFPWDGSCGICVEGGGGIADPGGGGGNWNWLTMQVLSAQQQENTAGNIGYLTMIRQNVPVRRMSTKILPPLHQNRRDPKNSALLDDGVIRD